MAKSIGLNKAARKKIFGKDPFRQARQLAGGPGAGQAWRNVGGSVRDTSLPYLATAATTKGGRASGRRKIEEMVVGPAPEVPDTGPGIDPQKLSEAQQRLMRRRYSRAMLMQPTEGRGRDTVG